ncbi:hypothetical protein AVEN_42803-1 [Araneus ventricosus]|uniref:Uncharacterized protein n=1 Tax=Araneus ventricosus TaxID=182803 RepID=A0A4Y2AEI5_ARAVE|nr:hypothetical protein AVEN_42803-1 [Araneus ventricosus]
MTTGTRLSRHSVSWGQRKQGWRSRERRACENATQGLFWCGPHNFGPWPDDEDYTCAGIPSPNFRTTQARGGFPLDVRFNVPHMRRIFDGIKVSASDPEGSRFEIRFH